MEKDDLKNMWNKYNSKLEEVAAINERMLKHTLRQSSNGVIERMLKWEYLTLIEFTVFLFFTFVATYKFMNDWKFLVSGIFITLFFIYCIIVNVLSIRQLNGIQLFSQSIVDIKQKLLMHKKLDRRFTKIFIFLIPPVIITFIPLGVKLIQNINLYDHPIFFLILSIIVILCSYIIFFISNKTIFSRGLKIIENSLKELEKFRDE
jgi:hypothetical protein